MAGAEPLLRKVGCGGGVHPGHSRVRHPERLLFRPDPAGVQRHGDGGPERPAPAGRANLCRLRAWDPQPSGRQPGPSRVSQLQVCLLLHQAPFAQAHCGRRIHLKAAAVTRPSLLGQTARMRRRLPGGEATAAPEAAQ